MTFPSAKRYLAAALRTPRHDSSLNDKLVHNNKVFHLFKEQGTHNNAKHLVKSKASEAATPKVDGIENLSRLSEARLDKLRKSLTMSKVIGQQMPSVFHCTQAPTDDSKEDDDSEAALPGKSIDSYGITPKLSAGNASHIRFPSKPKVLSPREAPLSPAQQELQRIVGEC